MKSVIAKQYGGPEVLQIETIEKPTPEANEILIKIHATSITAASIFMREGTPYFGRIFTGLTKPKVATPGTDLAGVVEAVGAEVTKFKVGDKVMAQTNLDCGAYAEYICLSQDKLVVHQPDNISHEEATGILDGAGTAIAFLTENVQLSKGQKILINGASGSIGTSAIQLAKYFGAEVTAVCSTRNKALVKDLGADMVLDYTKGELEICQDKFDVIFDTVGKLSFRKSKRLLTERGVFLTPVLEIPTLLTMLFVNPFSRKKLKFAATGLRKEKLRRRDLLKIRDLLATDKLKTVIDRVYPFKQIQTAHSYVGTGRKRGNVIVTFDK